ncbi:hypothetical protein HanRHA438_Chr13g0622861 [Helianthus annuus]|nr:hypothetical protein HanRHA438_Chr13g0622861 [Helianthus annuus]
MKCELGSHLCNFSNPTKSPSSLLSSTSLTTAHSVLTHHGFPIGLLPIGVFSYNLNTTTDEFSVDLGTPCRLILPPDNYLATYSKKVTGKIFENQIAELKGIRVRAFFQWWGITGNKINGDDLVFEVGMVTAKYPAKNFDESPHCEGKKHSSS